MSSKTQFSRIERQLQLEASFGQLGAKLTLVAGYAQANLAAQHDYPRGPAKQCYRNAAQLAMDFPELTYVEGIAQGGSILIPHAWCIDEDGRVVEATWPETGNAYWGAAYDTEFLIFWILKQKVWGVLHEVVAAELFTYLPERMFVRLEGDKLKQVQSLFAEARQALDLTEWADF
ncbi:hypothetical protein [Pseudorhodoferax soli]|nr:hypothetical protein [Pseudorhodoferax soli]